MYIAADSGYLRQDIDEALAERPEFGVDQLHRLIQFFEGRHSRAVEVLVNIGAAFIGGVVGALATWYFSGIGG